MLKSIEYIEQKFIKKNSVEKRDYQTSLSEKVKSNNCMIVLPTGLGKTIVALQVIAQYLAEKEKAILFLAPTRVLVNQHFEFLKANMSIDSIGLLTGEEPIEKRKKSWKNDIICATPEIVRNDFDREIAKPNQFSLIVFDEAHRTVGDYAYSTIAKRITNFNSVRILAMTATLPSEKQKIDEIISTLHIEKVEQRNEDSPDVTPYIQKTETQWCQVDLPAEMKTVQKLLKMELDSRYTQLAKSGLNITATKSLSSLLRIRPIVVSRMRFCSKALFTAIRITYALNIYEAHGTTSFLKFCERAEKKGGAGAKELFNEDSEFARAIHLARISQKNGLEHPKLDKLIEILRKQKSKVIVFSSFRDSVDTIKRALLDENISAEILIGKAGKDGLKQKKQIETLQRFRDGECQVLVSTRVGEEGLDVSEVNLVIFYDNVPSSIRHIQRKGRTGRKETGNLIILMAKDTIDEVYYWIGKKKMTKSKKITEKLNKNLKPKKKGLDKFV